MGLDSSTQPVRAFETCSSGKQAKSGSETGMKKRVSRYKRGSVCSLCLHESSRANLIYLQFCSSAGCHGGGRDFSGVPIAKCVLVQFIGDQQSFTIVRYNRSNGLPCVFTKYYLGLVTKL